jgi:DNA polymerase-1
MIPGIDQSAFEAQARYQNDPSTDFHEVAAEITGVPRKDAKGINFGVVYGMGKDSMAANLGKNLEEAEEVLKLFHGKFPFVKQTYNFVKDRADMRGFIRTISGRKRRFPKFQGKNWKTGEEYTGSEDEVAEWAQGQRGKGRVHIGREGTHAALNALLQGSSADIMKEAMVKMDQDGVFDVLRCHLTVHDELDSSFPDDAAGREAFSESVRIMETVRKLNVPATASANDGLDWNEAK